MIIIYIYISPKVYVGLKFYFDLYTREGYYVIIALS